MVGRSADGKVTAPVPRKENPDYDPAVEGSPRWLHDEPHVGGTLHDDRPEETTQTGFVRGGTTNPTGGVSGNVEQLDNDGNVSPLTPEQIARTVRDEGSQAGARRLADGR